MDLFPTHIVALPLASPEGTLGVGPAGASALCWPAARQGASHSPGAGAGPGPGQAAGLVAARQERMVAVMPVWHFPDPIDEEG